jgi:RNA recognition motif-containing protein
MCTVFWLTAFGFCEYGSPDSGLRAIRLLHDMDLGGKKLVVKVDAKTKTVLDEYKGTVISLQLQKLAIDAEHCFRF